MKERANWKEFDPSTFTHIARNDVAVSWVSNYRETRGLPKVSSVVLLGSGAVEPFTLAALPRFQEAEIIAVDLDEDVVSLAQDIKRGSSISWEDVAAVSLNPGRPNSDFLEDKRVRAGLSVLDGLGSLNNLGSEFNEKGITVPSDVSKRVSFVHSDALSFLKGLSTQPDLIGDFFMQVNINKNQEIGLDYTQGLVSESLDLLADDGFYLIGDTGKNLGKTVGHFSRMTTKGRLGIVSLVHAVNFGRGYATSHYLLASKLDKLPDERGLKDKAREAIKKSDRLSNLPTLEKSASTGELEEVVRSELSLSYVGDVSWSADQKVDTSLEKLVPEAGDEFSTEIVLPAQKPYLDND